MKAWPDILDSRNWIKYHEVFLFSQLGFRLCLVFVVAVGVRLNLSVFFLGFPRSPFLNNIWHPCLTLYSFLRVCILALTCRPVIHFNWLSCGWCDVGVRLHSFACRFSVVPAPFIAKIILSSILHCFVSLVRKICRL